MSASQSGHLEDLQVWLSAAAGVQPAYLTGHIANELLPHQEEGVKWMFKCVWNLARAAVGLVKMVAGSGGHWFAQAS